MTHLPLCEAIIQQLIAKSDPLRDSENAGMMHVTAVVEIVRAGFASLTEDELARLIVTNLAWVENRQGEYGLRVNEAAQDVMTLLRKD